MMFPVSHEDSWDEAVESGMASTRGRRLLESSSEMSVTWDGSTNIVRGLAERDQTNSYIYTG